MAQRTNTKPASILDSVIGERGKRELAAWYAQAFSGTYQPSKMLVLRGGNRSGKSSIANAIATLICDKYERPDAFECVPFGSLRGRFQLEKIASAKCVLIPDLLLGRFDDPAFIVSLLKSLLDRERITIERKYAAPFVWRSDLAILAATNEDVPHWLTKSAMSERLIIIDCIKSAELATLFRDRCATEDAVDAVFVQAVAELVGHTLRNARAVEEVNA